MMTRLVQLLLIILFCFTLIGCREIQVPEVIDVRSDMVRKIEFARDMRFDSTLGSDFEWLLDVDGEIEIIFVYPSTGFNRRRERDWSVFNTENPPSRVYFWFHSVYTGRVTRVIDSFIEELNIDLAEFNLSEFDGRNGIRIGFSRWNCNWEDVDNLWRSFDPSVREIIQARVDMIPTLRYARGMRLINNMINFDFDAFEAAVLLAPGRAPNITFVHNEEEALALFPGRDWSVYDGVENPPEVVILWPDKDQSQGAVNGLNQSVRINDINLEEFSLEYPITLADLVDNWEKVILVWETLSADRQNRIRNRAERYGVDAFEVAEEYETGETGDGSLSYEAPCQTIVLYLSLQKNHQAL